MSNNSYIASKPRYEILDGLRGVAAIMVLFFHFTESFYFGRSAEQLINHGYLAVDFFFVLSGFVIGYAYDDRWDRMSTWDFFKRRLVRLHPMVIIAAIVGSCWFFYVNVFLLNSTPDTTISLGMFVLTFLMIVFMIPCRPGQVNGLYDLNPFNSATWTLTYEYLANILYALVLRHLPKIAIACLCVVAAFFTLDLTLGWNLLGVLDAPQYTVAGGWCNVPKDWYIAGVRLMYPFLTGLLIAKILPSLRTESNPSGSPIKIKGGFWWAAIILAVLFAFPNIGGEMGFANGLYQALVIIVFFPIIILIGAGSRTTDPISTKICKFLGDISYPLYITHYPLMYIHMSWATRVADFPLWYKIAGSIGVGLIDIMFAYGVFKLIDEPSRKWLTEHWLKRGKKTTAAAPHRMKNIKTIL